MDDKRETWWEKNQQQTRRNLSLAAFHCLWVISNDCDECKRYGRARIIIYDGYNLAVCPHCSAIIFKCLTEDCEPLRSSFEFTTHQMSDGETYEEAHARKEADHQKGRQEVLI